MFNKRTAKKSKTPRTEAGRNYHTMMHGITHEHIANADCFVLESIIAIEDEAAQIEQARLGGTNRE